MSDSFLDNLVERFYPKSSEKIREVLATNFLLEKLATSVYAKLDNYVQQYADISDRIISLVQISQISEIVSVLDFKNSKLNNLFKTCLFLFHTYPYVAASPSPNTLVSAEIIKGNFG